MDEACPMPPDSLAYEGVVYVPLSSYNALRAKCDALRALARKHAVVYAALSMTGGDRVRGNICNECGTGWYGESPERHKSGCLVAPKEKL